MGDGGEYYAPKELMPIYRDTILPLADIITPNIFELSELSGIEITNEEECLNAISKIHSKCPNISIIVVTSGLISKDNSQMYCFASKNLKNAAYESGTEKPTAFQRELKMIESRFDLLVPNLTIESIDI
uniref:Pyridoxal kinase n=1 Tax=Panagrolaimus sp. ES5 TaxID=591445 RepID=A0AC34FS23_9BILA